MATSTYSLNASVLFQRDSSYPYDRYAGEVLERIRESKISLVDAIDEVAHEHDGGSGRNIRCYRRQIRIYLLNGRTGSDVRYNVRYVPSSELQTPRLVTRLAAMTLAQYLKKRSGGDFRKAVSSICKTAEEICAVATYLFNIQDSEETERFEVTVNDTVINS